MSQPVPGSDGSLTEREPSVDSQWTVVREPFAVEHEAVNQALLALADGVIGASGTSLSDASGGARRSVRANGVYTGAGSETRLLTAPGAFHVPVTIPEDAPLRRVLDLRTGVLYEDLTRGANAYSSARFSSLARPGMAVMRVAGIETAGLSALAPPIEDDVADAGTSGTVEWMRVRGDNGYIIAAGMNRLVAGADGAPTVERFVAYDVGSSGTADPATSVGRARAAATLGFDHLLNEHRDAWARRWDDADVEIDGDDELQLAARFALFHLIATVGDSGEAAVGARGLTGPSYRGHVFWDADTFVLPFMAATHPPAARAMLEYRVRRLPEALVAARRAGRAGARFPWESAATGEDVTPTSARDRAGNQVRILTGQLEDHIVADVAWAASTYIDWTGDTQFARGPGLQLFVESARYWASRVRIERDGSAHIDGVIGPDEYHECVDDNAFTNVMARWNLRRALEAVGERGARVDVDPSEQQRWRAVADGLIDGFDTATGIYEQFAGFRRLEPLIIAEVAPRRPIAADLLLGTERVQGAQVVKQADVLMLHHLIPDETVPGSLEANLHFYEPRTAHGSSLSPAIHASLFARTGEFERALAVLRVASVIDLDDLTGSTGGGLHVATMGGLWQALAFGFAGLRARGAVLQVDPRLPPEWRALDLRVRFRGSRLRVRVEPSGFRVDADAPVTLEAGGATLVFGPGTREFPHDPTQWKTRT
jgi:trehalose/maltose hydrolase-like predicted phosphorylase